MSGGSGTSSALGETDGLCGGRLGLTNSPGSRSLSTDSKDSSDDGAGFIKAGGK